MASTTQCPQGPQDPVFDIVKCDVPCIFPIPGGNWINDPQVPPAPDDIADCPAIPVPLPAPDPLCPEITFDGNPQGGQAQISVVPIGQERAFFRITKGECCDYDFDLEIDFPCPELISLDSSSQSKCS